MSDPCPPRPGDVVRVQVPFAIRKRGGRKLVLVPGGNDVVLDRPRVDNAMVKALARAFRWRKLLETGACGTVEELADAEKINTSYVSRILRLTLLSPHIVDQILDGRHKPEMTLSKIVKPFPLAWSEQLATLKLDPSIPSSGPTRRKLLRTNGLPRKEQT
jgi:hypothetical protein